MKRHLKIIVVLALVGGLQSCATLGRTAQAVGRTVTNVAGAL